MVLVLLLEIPDADGRVAKAGGDDAGVLGDSDGGDSLGGVAKGEHGHGGEGCCRDSHTGADVAEVLGTCFCRERWEWQHLIW